LRLGFPLVPDVHVTLEVVADVIAHVHLLDVTIFAKLAGKVSTAQ
jgi:hypothetical protein